MMHEMEVSSKNLLMIADIQAQHALRAAHDRRLTHSWGWLRASRLIREAAAVLDDAYHQSAHDPRQAVLVNFPEHV